MFRRGRWLGTGRTADNIAVTDDKGPTTEHSKVLFGLIYSYLSVIRQRAVLNQ